MGPIHPRTPKTMKSNPVKIPVNIRFIPISDKKPIINNTDDNPIDIPTIRARV